MDDVREQADQLLATTQIHAAATAPELADRYPHLAGVFDRTSDWDYFAPIAGVAASLLQPGVPREKLLPDVLTVLAEWDPDAPRTIQDLLATLGEHGMTQDLDLLLGNWLISHAHPGNEVGPLDPAVVSAVVKALIAPFADWWHGQEA